MRSTLIYIILLTPVFVVGQNYIQYPDLLRSFSNFQEMNHPAWVQDSGKVVLKIARKMRSGPLKKIGLNYFSAAYQSKNTSKAHVFRINGVTETEGPYINKPRVYGNYAYQQKLSKDVKVSLGMTVGVVQNIIQAPTADLSQESTIVDGALGLGVWYKKWNFLISSQQLLNSVVKFERQDSLNLRHYLVYTVMRTVTLNADYDLELGVYHRLLKSAPDDVFLQIGGSYQDKIRTGTVLEWRRGTSFYFEVKNFITEYPLSVLFVYRSSLFSNQPTELNHVEIGVGYFF